MNVLDKSSLAVSLISRRSDLPDFTRDRIVTSEKPGQSQLFDPRKVLAAAEKKFGAAAAWFDIESVWALLDLRDTGGDSK